VWIKPQPGQAPTLSVELPDPDQLAGPCFLWHAASVIWSAAPSAQGVGASGARQILYFGALVPGTFNCAPNNSVPLGYSAGAPTAY
jgi:hypothetical protein